MNDKIWTIGRILKWTEQYFKDKGIESPRLDAEVLLAHVLEKQRIYLYVHFDEPLQPGELAAYREMIKKRVLRVPVAQILGEKAFMGLTFKVTADTLVPRPDTEILVQAAVDRLRAMAGEEPLRFADIGTGSGAICLSVLHYLAGTVADTVDIRRRRAPSRRRMPQASASRIASRSIRATSCSRSVAYHLPPSCRIRPTSPRPTS